MRLLLRYLAALSLVFVSTVVLAQELDEEPSGPWPNYEKPNSTDATSLKLIDLHLQVRGGEESLKKVASLKMEGVLLEGKVDSRLTTSCLISGAANSLTNRFFRGDDYIITSSTSDGDSWQQNLSPEKGLPRKIGGLDEKLLKLEGLLPWLFVDLANTGHVFSYQGQENFAGKPVYKIHGWLSNGMQIDVLFDMKSFHIVNYRHIFRIGGNEVIVDRLPTGLSRSENVWWESGYSFRVRGKSFRKVTYETITGNAALRDDLFKMPFVRERWLRITPDDA